MNEVVHNILVIHERPSKESIHMVEALIASRRSTCAKLKTGCVIVKDDRVVATGYNGVLSKQKHCDDIWLAKYEAQDPMQNVSFEQWKLMPDFLTGHKKWAQIHEVHGEVNALIYAGFSNTRGSNLYTVFSPCSNCAKLIVAAKINTVYYMTVYQDTTSINFLRENGVVVTQIKSEMM